MFNIVTLKKELKKHLYHHVPKYTNDKIQLQVSLYNLPAEFV